MMKKESPIEESRRVGNRPCTASLGVAFLLCLAGCGDQVRTLTPQERAAFEQAGSIRAMVNMNRIQKAKLKTGPYRVVPGDVLEFTMPALLQAVTAAEVQAAQANNSAINPFLARVRDNGAIVLPAVGPMTVAGYSLSKIEEMVTEAYKNYVVPHPSVFVRVAEYKTAKVYISGAVKKPGVFSLPSDQMTLSSLLTQAEGISEAGAAVVRILRAQASPEAADDAVPGGSGETQDVSPADLRPFPPASPAGARLADPKPIVLPVVSTNIPYRDVSLDDGDTVVVEPVQMPLFSVLGLVMQPGNFPYPPGAQYNLTQAIAFAGGLDPVARPYYATIYRLNEDGTVARAPVRLIEHDQFTQALGTPIRPGDVVAVENTPRTRMNTAIRDLLRINAGFYISGQDLWDNGN